MGQFANQLAEIAPRLRLRTPGGEDIDFSGLDSCKVMLQLNAADEFNISLPAQLRDNKWRSDMPIWQNGAVIHVECGYNGSYDFLQSFEIVHTDVNYGQDAGGETLNVQGVSDLARAARKKDARTFDSGSDVDVLTQICDEYGWKNGVTSTNLLNPPARLKEHGKSDLDLLKLMAREAKLGGPRITQYNVLIMPEPTVGDLKFSRGAPNFPGSDWRRIHSIQANRDGGATVTTVAVVGWDPDKNAFVETEFAADEFGGDPVVIYEGPPAVEGLKDEATTQGLVLSVLEHRGRAKTDRVDILSSGRFTNETDAASLAKRWFELRERLSRWADIDVDGNFGLNPYESVRLDGNLANMDKGIWLPIRVEHEFGANGWMSNLRAVRVVTESVVTPSNQLGFRPAPTKTSS